MKGKKFEMHVLIEFKDLQTAQACYEPEEYRFAREQRQGCCDVMITLVESL